MAGNRTSLTIRCSQEEAEILRGQAAAEHRTLSGCLLNILEGVLEFEESYPVALRSLIHAEGLIPPSRQGTKILLRCSAEQADRIRRAAIRRQTSISKFVVFSLRRFWRAKATVTQKLARRNAESRETWNWSPASDKS